MPDDQRFISASADQTLRISKLGKEDAKPKTMRGHRGIVMTLACSPDGKTVASSSNDRTLRLWNAETGGLRAIHRLDTIVNAIAFTRDSKNLVLGCDDTTVVFWPVRFEGGESKTLMDWLLELFSKEG